MRVQRSSWERVTEKEELVGRLRAVSRLPQYLGFVKLVLCCGGRGLGTYLITAMLTGAVTVALNTSSVFFSCDIVMVCDRRDWSTDVMG